MNVNFEKIPEKYVTGEYIHHDYFYKQVQSQVNLNILFRAYTYMYDRATSESTEIITRNKSRACTLYGVYEERGDGAEGFLGVKNALLPK